MRLMVKRILGEYGYLPDIQVKVAELVLEQAEVICTDIT
jgi:hypothetical protein